MWWDGIADDGRKSGGEVMSGDMGGGKGGNRINYCGGAWGW